MLAVNVNYLAVVVAAAVSMALGAFWYAPGVMGKAWLEMIGKKESSLRGGDTGKKYGLMAVAALFTAYVMAHFVSYAGATSVAEGLQTGFWLWLGFVITTNLGDYLFAGRPIKLYYLNMGYHLLSFMVMGALLAAWQ